MNAEAVKDEDKILCAASYAIGIPALYVMLTEKRKEKFTGYHGAQALFLWVAYLLVGIIFRVVLDLILNIVYIQVLEPTFRLVMLLLWLYALYCAYRAYTGEYFSIPYITDFARKSGALK